MSLWYTQSRRRASDTGKFCTGTRLGTKKSLGDQHRGWSYHFVSHSTGTSVRRTTYSVSILDPYQNRVAYLRDFANMQQAATAARKWIDRALSHVWPKPLGGSVGKIPAVPTQEVPTQEK